MAAPKQSAKKAPAKKPVAKQRPAAKKAVAKKAVAKKAVAKKGSRQPTKKAAAKLSRPAPKKKGPKLAVKNGPARAVKQVAVKPAVKAKPTARAKPVAAEAPRVNSDSTTPARDARQLLEQRKAIKTALAPTGDGKTIVDAYMRDVDHPFKAEMEAVRQIILGVSDKLSERIKWNAPSFYYKEDLGAFNPRATEFAHLILLFPGGGALPEKSQILEGTHKDRREVKFRGMDEVKSKQRALEKIIKDWIALRDS